MEKSKETKLIGVIASVFLLFIVFSAAFAYFGSFNVDLNNNVAVNINAVSPGNASFVSSATQLNLQVPAANMSQTAADNETPAAENTAILTVNLTGAANLLTTCTYDIVYEYDANSNVYGVSPTTKNGDKEITLQVSRVNGINNFASEKNFDSTTISSYKNGNVYILVSGATIESDGTLATQNILITGKYYNLTISQSSLEGKIFTGKIYVTNHSCSTSENVEYGYITILNDNGGKDTIEKKATPNFDTSTVVGMFSTKDDLGTSYYFRGAVENNYLKFGKDSSGNDMLWRIVRINGDGTIRIILNDGIGQSAFNGNYDKSEYVGYQYILGKQHGYGKCDGYDNEFCENDEGDLVYNSTVKQLIDRWFISETSLGNTDTLNVADAIYCNDRSASSTQTDTWTSETDYDYGFTGRVVQNNNPSLICPLNDDRFTIDKISELGNSALTYPVGLLTGDEFIFAGGLFSSSSEENNYNVYLSNDENQLLGSPMNFFNNESFMAFHQTGFIYVYPCNENHQIRPVISLVSTVKLSGDGTYTNPYVVE